MSAGSWIRDVMGRVERLLIADRSFSLAGFTAVALVVGLPGCSEEAAERPSALFLPRPPDFHGLQDLRLNEPLVIEFSEDVGAFSLNADSIRVETRDGRLARGRFVREPQRVTFEPLLAHRTLRDGGLLPDTEYRVIVRGFPHFTGVFTKDYRPLDRSYEFSFRTRADDDVNRLYWDPRLDERATIVSLSIRDEPIAWRQRIPLDRKLSESFLGHGLDFHFNKHLLPVARGEEPLSSKDIQVWVIDEATPRSVSAEVILSHDDDGSILTVRPLDGFQSAIRPFTLAFEFVLDESGESSIRDLSGFPIVPFRDQLGCLLVVTPTTPRGRSRLTLGFLEGEQGQPVLSALDRGRALRTRGESSRVSASGWRLETSGNGVLELLWEPGVPAALTLGEWRPETSIVLNTDEQAFVTASGGIEEVVGGRFDFDRIEIPFGVEVRATGSRPLVLRAREDIVVHGRLDVSGEPGQLGIGDARRGERPFGGLGGPGGGRGGEGGISPLFEIAAPTSGETGYAPGDRRATGGAGGSEGLAGEPAPSGSPRSSWIDGWTERLIDGQRRSVVDSLGAVAALRGGRGGGGGGASRSTSANGGGGGGGGGVAVLIAGGAIRIDGGELRAGGGVGAPGGPEAGGGGGGGAGGLLLSAAGGLTIDGAQVLAQSGTAGGSPGWIQLEDFEGEIAPTRSILEPDPWIFQRPQGQTRQPGRTRQDPSTNVARYTTPVIDLGQDYGRVLKVQLQSQEVGGRCRAFVWTGAEAPEGAPPEGEFRGADRLGTDAIRFLAVRIEFEVDDLTIGDPVQLSVDDIIIDLSR